MIVGRAIRWIAPTRGAIIDTLAGSMAELPRRTHQRAVRGPVRSPSAGISDVAPSCVQQRTMSRTESMPTISPLSTTIRWRKPPRAIVSAACSSDHSGSANDEVGREVVADVLAVDVQAPRRRRSACPAR